MAKFALSALHTDVLGSFQYKGHVTPGEAVSLGSGKQLVNAKNVLWPANVP